MTNTPTHMHDEPRCTTNGALVLTLAVAALLDMATSTALSLTDHSPSVPVIIFRIVDAYASPATLVASVITGTFWLLNWQKAGKLLFSVTLAFAMLALLDNLVGLIVSLFDKQDDPADLLLSASLVYVESLAVFAAYYWKFDNPYQVRIAAGEKIHPGIVFPHNMCAFDSLTGWKPTFMDYAFLSFNTASTFGPTLPIPLRNPIQIGMMLQVAIAMAVLIMLAARAIGLIS
jgi:hypothetical protein